MKTKLTKLFSLLMAGALVLSLAACSGAGDGKYHRRGGIQPGTKRQ